MLSLRRVSLSKKKYTQALSSKFIIALLLAGGAILVSWLFTKVTFKKMLGTVHQLSQPHPKLQLVNAIFRDVVKLDQLQRQQALKTSRKSYNPFLKESYDIKKKLDSLQLLSADNKSQVSQIDSMKYLLDERDKVFLNYLSLRKNFIINDTITEQIRMLSGLIGSASTSIDSSVVTTEKKITTTTIEDVATDSVEQKQNFWDKLIGRKKTPEKTKVKKLIQEELNIKIDTVTKANEDSIIQQLSETIADKEALRSGQRDKLIDKQIQLNRTGGLIISRVLGMLQQLEDEELQQADAKNIHATELVNSGIQRINLIVVIFLAGTILLIVMFFTDVAKSNQYRKELITAKEEAEELQQVKHRFLSNMSHELRTPLQAIVGIAEQAKITGAATNKEVNTIYQSSQHLLQIVNEVLDYSRIISGKFSLQQQPFNMQLLLEEVGDIIRAKTDAKNIAFQIVTEKTYPSYIGDAFRLKQILLNLLGNAVKFTQQGSIALIVSTKEFSARTAFTFNIKDTGIGISEEDQQRIFYQFEQGNTSYLQNHEGTGLGLSIVRSLVEMQKGTLTLQSEIGKGSQFTVSLSYTPTLQLPATVQNKPVSTKNKLWVIDDDVLILNLCKTILDKYEIPNAIFHSAHDALATFISSDVKLIFIDIRMPEMSGFEVCKQLRQKTGNDVHIVALTAQALPEDRSNILAHGFDDILIKPFLEKELMHFLNEDAFSSKIDFTNLEKMTGGDHQMMQKILTSFVDETENDIAVLNKGISNEDTATIAAILHKLSGRTAQFGMSSMGGKLREMEIIFREQQHFPHELADMLKALCKELTASLLQVQNKATIYNNVATDC